MVDFDTQFQIHRAEKFLRKSEIFIDKNAALQALSPGIYFYEWKNHFRFAGAHDIS